MLKNNLICGLFIGILSFASTTFAQVYTQEALMAYVEIEDVERVKQLLERGVDPDIPDVSWHNYRDCDGLVNVKPIHCAVKTGNKEIVRLLIRHGVNVNVMGAEAGNPLQAALTYDYPEIADMIVNAPTFDAKTEAMYSGGRFSPYLEVAIRHENARLIRILLDRGANPDLIRGDARQNMDAILRAYETTVTPSSSNQ